MKTHRRRRIRWVVGLVFAAMLLPWLFSRLLSGSRMVRMRSLPSTGVEEGDRIAPPRQLRVVGYNIAHGRGLAESNWQGGRREERKQRLDSIAKLLRELDADVVVLNEVDFDSSWSFSTNQAEYLAKAVGYSHWAEQRNLDARFLFWKWRFGNAVLSRFPIRNAEVIDLPSYSAGETWLAGKKRGLLCEVEIADRRLQVAAVHLSHRSESVRAKSVDHLMSVVSEESSVVVGDFNSTPTGFPQSASDPELGNAIDRLDGSGLFQRFPKTTPAAFELTFSSDKPRSVIDWIMISQSLEFVGNRVIASRLSDHRPVVADIRWK